MTKDAPKELESVLAAASARGDLTAWRALYDAHFAAVLTYVRKRAGDDRSMVDDIVQETWMVAVRKIGAFDALKGPFRAWITGIAAKVLMNAGRRSRPAVAELTDLAAPETKDTESDLERGLAEIPDHYRRVLRARYEDALSTEEIARRFAETPKAIESLLARARRALRERLERQDIPERRANLERP